MNILFNSHVTNPRFPVSERSRYFFGALRPSLPNRLHPDFGGWGRIGDNPGAARIPEAASMHALSQML